MSHLEEVDVNQDLVFTGPVTQEELIITWKKRRQERLERERAEGQARKPGPEDANETSTENDEAGETERRSDRIPVPVPDAVAPSTSDGDAEPAQLPLKPTSNILRPAKLNVDGVSFTTDWARRINMKKLDRPKRPAYVQPLE